MLKKGRKREAKGLAVLYFIIGLIILLIILAIIYFALAKLDYSDQLDPDTTVRPYVEGTEAEPFADNPEKHDGPLCLLSTGLAVSLCLFSWFLLLCFRFDRESLYLPLLAPLDMAQALCLAGAFLWFRGSEAMPDVLRTHLKQALFWAFFLFANVMAARAVAAWTGCAYTAGALLASPVFRVTLSVLWGGVALGCMIVASHLRKSRRLWFVGLTLLLLTLGKLVFLDLADTETAYRSLSFVAVGLLMLGMGWFCPLPPRDQEE